MTDDQALMEDVRDLLRTHGPLTLAALANHLAERGRDVPTDPDALYDELLWAEGDFQPLSLADERLVDLQHLLDGLVVTHRITDAEREAGEVAADPDLIVAHILAGDGRHVPTSDGGTLTYTRSDTFAGPQGWLPDDPVLTLTLRETAVEVGGAPETPGPDPALAERLADTYGTVVGQVAFLEVPELLIEARVRHPELMAEPQAPLAELLPAGGLELEDGRLPRPGDGADWDDTDELVRHLSEDHGFGVDTVADLLQVSNAALHFSNVVLGEVADALEGTRPVDLPDRLGDAVDEPKGSDALRRLLTEQPATIAVLHDVVGTDPLLATAVLAMLDGIAGALETRHAQANGHWLRARMIEFVADDHAEAERELGRALDADPDHGETIFDLARYRADRGEAGAALGLLRQLDGGGDPRWVEVLERYAQPGPTSAGRNDPCPCGSGRKHKVCCGPRNGWPLEERLTWLWDKIWRNATMPHGIGPLDDVAAEAGLGPDETVFDDAVLVNLASFEGGMVEEFAATRGALVPADELELLHELAEVRAGAYEVVTVEPGEGVEVLDLRTGERAQLADRSMSRNVEEGEVLLLWLAPGADGPEVIDGGMHVPARAIDSLLEILDEDLPGPTPLTRWYRRLFAPPELRNTEDEPREDQ